MIGASEHQSTIDQARLTALIAVMGRERVGQLVHLAQERVTALRADIASSGSDCRVYRAALHQSGGSASSLGLLSLAASLNRLEAAIDWTPAGIERLEAPEGAIASALAELDELQTRTEIAVASFIAGFTDNHTGDSAGALNL